MRQGSHTRVYGSHDHFMYWKKFPLNAVAIYRVLQFLAETTKAYNKKGAL